MKRLRTPLRPGQVIRSQVRISRGAHHIELPVWVASGRQAGPTGLLSAGIHGDEIHAITVLHRFVRDLDLEQLAGRLLILPVANVSGYHAGTRTVPEDGRDLNRCFPGDSKGTLSERIAHFIFNELAAHADWGVDLHDSGAGSVLLPHARVHDPDLLGLGAAFGTEIVMKTTLPAGYHGILSIEAHKRYRRPFFHVEIGGGAVAWESLIEKGVTGLRNLLVYQRMLPGQLLLPRQQLLLPGRDTLTRPAPIEGLLVQHAALGEFVPKGRPLATIQNPLNHRHAIIRARCSGIVHDLNVRAKVNAGEDVVGVIGTNASRDSAKRWRHSVECITNRPGETIRIHAPELLRVDNLCWRSQRLKGGPRLRTARRPRFRRARRHPPRLPDARS